MRESGRHCAIYIPYKVCIVISGDIMKMINLIDTAQPFHDFLLQAFPSNSLI